MAKSQTILGRVRNRNAFYSKTWFKVSVYETRQGKRFFTDPLQWPYSSPNPSVLYRIIVTAKRG
jgi:hypothetical protein